jgi:FAD/FMN-containing dehydrogenase/Fe-S oxidoreductase
MDRPPSVRETAVPAAAAEELAAELRARISGEVRFDAGSRALYATDGSVYRQVPIGVVLPRNADEVATTVGVCRRHGAPVLARGCGTSLKGQCCNVAVVIDCSKYMHHVVGLDPGRKQARVEPGVICDQLRDAARPHGLTFGPDPATHNHCTLGGMIGNNSCGVHSVMAGKTDDNVDELEVLTYDGLRLRVGPTDEQELERIIAGGGRRGDIYRRLRDLRDRYADLIRRRYPHIPRRVSGYNLPWLLPENGFHVARALVGSESTCVVVLEATTRLVHSPAERALVVLGYPDVATGCDHVPEILEHGPIGLEGFDDGLIADLRKKGRLLANVGHLPEGGGWLLVEFGADRRQDALDRARGLVDRLRSKPGSPQARLLEDPAEQEAIWQIRESAVGVASAIPDERFTWPTWEDSAVPPERFGAYLRDFRALMDRHRYSGAFFGHFGQGCLHVRIDYDLRTTAGIAAFRAFLEEAADLVVAYGGSFSGEHGDGQVNGELLPKMFGPELIQAFREFKAIWDPDGKMNPGKVVDAYPLDSNLRLGTDYHPPDVRTHFRFPEDEGSFAHATLRCIGIGRCRRLEGGTMCPSFMATREEQHSTRGRARLLFEMLQGTPLDRGWRDEHVKEALDLCLSCKGCKGDCPVGVDMATYKAEFLAHYYAGRLRPRQAYAFGLIMYWARLAALAPGLVNLLTQAPGLRALAKAATGMAPRRRIPAFAARTFQAWFARRDQHAGGGPPVILWPDTFNNFFHPETARAAVEVLEAAGYRVLVPPWPLCCGRPLYDYGMLDRAEHLLRRVLAALRAPIRAGVPVVGLEPSCVSVFRDELEGLLPHDTDAQRLSQQTFLLSEFLLRAGYQPPRLEGRALVHGHCHQKAVLTMDAEEELLGRLGLEVEAPDTGCCGMAGGFGFEAGAHYDVSIRCGERVLLPAVRAAAKDTLIIASGFSCREQIAQTTDRRALHLAEVLRMAHAGQRAGRLPPYPERARRPPLGASAGQLSVAR